MLCNDLNPACGDGAGRDGGGDLCLVRAILLCAVISNYRNSVGGYKSHSVAVLKPESEDRPSARVWLPIILARMVPLPGRTTSQSDG